MLPGPSASKLGRLGPLRALVVGAVVLWAVALAWLLWHFQKPPVDLALLEQLRPGMPSHEVHAILGTPRTRHAKEWVYSRALSWPIVYVYFDDEQRFRRSRYDD